MKDKFTKASKAALVAAFWLIIWELLSLAAGKKVLLPSPVAVLMQLSQLVVTKSFWMSCGASLIRICSGLLCGAVAGTLVAVTCIRSKAVSALVSPVLSVVRATPVASFIILALVWLGRGRVPAFTSFLMVLPIMSSSVIIAIHGVDKQLLEMMRALDVPNRKILTKLYIPSVLPSFAGGFKTSLGLAWKAGVAAEVLCTPKYSIGTSLYESKIYLETAELFAWTATVIVLSMILEHMFDRLTRYLQLKYVRDSGGCENA